MSRPHADVCLQARATACIRTKTFRAQVREEAKGPYRHISAGAWPFSSRDHGWPISDCTSEGVKAALGLAALGEVAGPAIPPERIFEAANVILSYQNHDGGWATYENTRSFHAFEVRRTETLSFEWVGVGNTAWLEHGCRVRLHLEGHSLASMLFRHASCLLCHGLLKPWQ